MRSAQRVGHHDQFLEKKKKTKTATIEAIIISFFRVLFRLFMACYTFHSCAGWVCNCVCVCVCGRLLSMTSLLKKLACKTSWPFVSVANNNRANHLNDITRKWNVNNTLCHATIEKNLTDRYPVLIQLKQAKDMLKVSKEKYDKQSKEKSEEKML